MSLAFREMRKLKKRIFIIIIHTVLYNFPKVLTRKICLTIKSLFSW